MARGRKEQIRASIEALNAIQVGELSAIDNKVAAAREELRTLNEPELERSLEESRRCLAQGDVTNFRRLLAQTVSRLGHLK